MQGLTEFLPVSSSGHILLLGEIFNVDLDIIFLSVVAHLGTLLSVIICMRKKLIYSIKHPFCKTNWQLLVATLPCVIGVLLFNEWVDKLYSIYFLVAGFLITGILLIVADIIKHKNQFKHNKFTLSNFFVIAIASNALYTLNLPGIPTLILSFLSLIFILKSKLP